MVSNIIKLIFSPFLKNAARIKHLLQSQNKLNPNDCLTETCWIM